MLIFGIILLILFGLLLLVVEIFILPGISIAGIGSIILLLSGIIISFMYLGSQAGLITLLATGVSTVLVLYYAFKPSSWNKISLKNEMNSKALDDSHFDHIKAGDIGVTVSRMAPMGEVEVNGFRFEAVSDLGIIDAGTKVEVLSINNNKITIKSL